VLFKFELEINFRWVTHKLLNKVFKVRIRFDSRGLKRKPHYLLSLLLKSLYVDSFNRKLLRVILWVETLLTQLHLSLLVKRFKRSLFVLLMSEYKLLVNAVPGALVLGRSHNWGFVFGDHQLTGLLYKAQAFEWPVVLFFAHLVGTNVHFVWKVDWRFFEGRFVKHHRLLNIYLLS